MIRTIWSAGRAVKQILDDMNDNRSESLELKERVARLLPMLETLLNKVNSSEDLTNMNPFLSRLDQLIQDSTDLIRQLPSNGNIISKVLKWPKEAAISAETKQGFAALNLKFDRIIMELSVMEIMNGSAKIGKMGATLDEIAEMLRLQVFHFQNTSDGSGTPMSDADDERSNLGEGVFGVTYCMRCTGEGGLYAGKKIKIAKAVKNGVSKETLSNEATITNRAKSTQLVAALHGYLPTTTSISTATHTTKKVPADFASATIAKNKQTSATVTAPRVSTKILAVVAPEVIPQSAGSCKSYSRTKSINTETKGCGHTCTTSSVKIGK